MLAREYSGSPAGLVSSWWKLVFAVVIALSALVAVRSERRPLSWRVITAITIAGAAIAGYPAVEAATVTMTVLDRDDERSAARLRADDEALLRARLADVEALLAR